MSDVLQYRRRDQAHSLPAPAAVTNIDLYGALLADASNVHTRRARVGDSADLTRYLGMEAPRAACDLVTGGTAGQANTVALGYKADLHERKLSPGTINR